jgi:hypothetical protein
VVANIQRFVSSPGILPANVSSHDPGLWLSQARYQAPYADTADAIRKAKQTAIDVDQLRNLVHPATDIVVCVHAQNGVVVSTIVSSQLPDVRVAVVGPFHTLELDGLLYSHQGSSLEVGPGGRAVVMALSPAPGLTALASQGLATETAIRVHKYAVWIVSPGATFSGVTVDSVAGPRPLGQAVS